MKLIPEEALEQTMRDEVEPYLARCGETGKLNDALYWERYVQPGAKGTVVISHGFTEASVKYHEFIWYLLQAGWNCAVLDHRGHGFSARAGKQPDVVHIERFQDYVEDLHAFVQSVVLPKADGGPLCLYGHSMGGCIAARYLETYPGDFERAVLNAPMLGLKTGSMPPWLGEAACRAMILLGKGEERLYFHGDFEPDPVFEDDVAMSRARFDLYQSMRRREKALQTSSASYRWTREAIGAGRRAVREAEKILVPVLLFQAENDTLVSGEAQEAFMKRVRKGRLVRVAGSKHEIYRSENAVLEGYFQTLLSFLEAKRPESGTTGG